MRKPQKLIVGMLAVLLFAMLADVTTSASASEYLCGGEGIKTANNCLVHGVILNIWRLEDRGSIPGSMTCNPEAITSEGGILSPTEGEITSVVFSIGSGKCEASTKALNLKEEEVTNNCTKIEKIEPINLPWTTKIEEELTGLVWILIFKASKEPGYKITCESGGIKGIADTCESEEAHTPLVLAEDLSEEEEIESVKVHLWDSFFLAASELLEPEEFANCSLGGKHEGIVIGEILWWALINSKAASLEVT